MGYLYSHNYYETFMLIASYLKPIRKASTIGNTPKLIS